DAAARAGLGARRVRAVGAGDAAGVACGAGVVVVVVGCRVVVAGRRGVVALLFAFCAAATAASMSTSAAMVNELLIMMITSFEKSSVVSGQLSFVFVSSVVCFSLSFQLTREEQRTTD